MGFKLIKGFRVSVFNGLKTVAPYTSAVIKQIKVKQMNLFRKSLIVLSIILLFGCSEDENMVESIIEIEKESVGLRFYFLGGFNNQDVYLEHNHVTLFHAMFSQYVSLGGIQAQFWARFEKGQHSFLLSINGLPGSDLTIRDSVHVTLGEESEYYLLLQVINDTLKTTFQEEPFYGL